MATADIQRLTIPPGVAPQYWYAVAPTVAKNDKIRRYLERVGRFYSNTERESPLRQKLCTTFKHRYTLERLTVNGMTGQLHVRRPRVFQPELWTAYIDSPYFVRNLMSTFKDVFETPSTKTIPLMVALLGDKKDEKKTTEEQHHLANLVDLLGQLYNKGTKHFKYINGYTRILRAFEIIPGNDPTPPIDKEMTSLYTDEDDKLPSDTIYMPVDENADDNAENAENADAENVDADAENADAENADADAENADVDAENADADAENADDNANADEAMDEGEAINEDNNAPNNVRAGANNQGVVLVTPALITTSDFSEQFVPFRIGIEPPTSMAQYRALQETERRLNSLSHERSFTCGFPPLY